MKYAWPISIVHIENPELADAIRDGKMVDQTPPYPSERAGKNSELAVQSAPHNNSTNNRMWPVMDGAAYHGLAGDVVRTIEPQTEADPIAILIQVLIYFGNVIGRFPHYRVEADDHHANLFAVLVGQSAKGRKGTSGGRARSVMTTADERWSEDRMKGGLSTGEGLIDQVRDPVERWDAKAQQFETIDPGAADKRLMVIEPEFVNALVVMERPGNTLSPTIRKAWDGQTLTIMTKNSPAKATGAHISIVGHITEQELRANLTRTHIANGFANRFLFALVKRARLLPHGGNLQPDAIDQLSKRVKTAVEFAKTVGRVTMTDAAQRGWEAAYPDLSAEQSGLLGAITARGEAQVIRLAMIYALLDRVGQIDVLHLKAGLALWSFCEASAARIFGDSLGDPVVADEILLALQQAGVAGMTRTAIRDLFGRNRSGDRIGAALALLMTKRRARTEVKTTGGRPSEMWFAIRGWNDA